MKTFSIPTTRADFKDIFSLKKADAQAAKLEAFTDTMLAKSLIPLVKLRNSWRKAWSKAQELENHG